MEHLLVSEATTTLDSHAANPARSTVAARNDCVMVCATLPPPVLTPRRVAAPSPTASCGNSRGDKASSTDATPAWSACPSEVSLLASPGQPRLLPPARGLHGQSGDLLLPREHSGRRRSRRAQEPTAPYAGLAVLPAVRARALLPDQAAATDVQGLAHIAA